jgi:hypothetical protein
MSTAAAVVLCPIQTAVEVDVGYDQLSAVQWVYVTQPSQGHFENCYVTYQKLLLIKLAHKLELGPLYTGIYCFFIVFQLARKYEPYI